MMHYVITDASGLVVGKGHSGSETDALASVAGDLTAVICEDHDGFEPMTSAIVGGVLKKIAPAPGPWAVWDGSQWVDPRTAEDVATEDAARAAEAMRQLRAERDRRLATSDWTQMSDAPLTDAQRDAWRVYRQALRDVPETADPAQPVWPEPPNA